MAGTSGHSAMNAAQTSEEQSLIKAAVGGDQAAYETLFWQYQTRLIGYIGVRVDSDDDAQEILDHVREEAWRDMKHYDPSRGSIRAFFGSRATAMVKRFHSGLPPFRERQRGEDAAGELEGPRQGNLQDQVTESAEEVALRHMLYRDLLDAVFIHQSAPHQLQAFGFVRLLQWPPREVAQHFSDMLLRCIQDRLERDIAVTAQVSVERVQQEVFRRLRERLCMTVHDAIEDGRTRKLYPELMECIAGDTKLSQYYRRDPEVCISSWCHSVFRGAVATFIKQHGHMLGDA